MLTRHSILMYLLVAPSCNYLRPVLVLVIELDSHHLQILPKYQRYVLLVSLLPYVLGRRYSQSVVTELNYAFWFLSCSD